MGGLCDVAPSQSRTWQMQVGELFAFPKPRIALIAICQLLITTHFLNAPAHPSQRTAIPVRLLVSTQHIRLPSDGRAASQKGDDTCAWYSRPSIAPALLCVEQHGAGAHDPRRCGALYWLDVAARPGRRRCAVQLTTEAHQTLPRLRDTCARMETAIAGSAAT